MGFRNDQIENMDFDAREDGVAVCVEQLYAHALLDGDGTEVAGTQNELFVTQIVRFNEVGKICGWEQQYNGSIVEASRAMATEVAATRAAEERALKAAEEENAAFAAIEAAAAKAALEAAAKAAKAAEEATAAAEEEKAAAAVAAAKASEAAAEACDDVEGRNEAIARECFELQATLAMGSVTPEKMAECGKYFAETIDLKVNETGPATSGSFGEVSAVLGEVWMGFRNDKIENEAFTVKEKGSTVLVEQLYSHALLDAETQYIPGTRKTIKIMQNLSFNKAGKICGWEQRYDASVIEASRAMADSPAAARNLVAAEECFELHLQLSLAIVSPKYVSQNSAVFPTYFADTVELKVNETGPQLNGSISEVRSTLQKTWFGFRNDKIANQEIKSGADNTSVTVEQLYSLVLVDAEGAEVEGTRNELKVKQTLCFDSRGKISGWHQQYDSAVLEGARAKGTPPHQAWALCWRVDGDRATFEVEGQEAFAAACSQLLGRKISVVAVEEDTSTPSHFLVRSQAITQKQRHTMQFAATVGGMLEVEGVVTSVDDLHEHPEGVGGWSAAALAEAVPAQNPFEG